MDNKNHTGTRNRYLTTHLICAKNKSQGNSCTVLYNANSSIKANFISHRVENIIPFPLASMHQASVGPILLCKAPKKKKKKFNPWLPAGKTQITCFFRRHQSSNYLTFAN